LHFALLADLSQEKFFQTVNLFKSSLLNQSNQVQSCMQGCDDSGNISIDDE